MELGDLRYHALWAYTGLTALLTVTDKLPLGTVEAAVAILAPIGLVIAADIAKYRNSISKRATT